MPQPLAGLLVLDFSTLLPGPLATLMLAEAGAEVVKIEPPGGEDMRSYLPFWEGESLPFALLNRGKRCLRIDLKDAGGRAQLEPLIAQADIVVEQFRPGVMRRLALDHATLRARNPRLIYCSISGYGQEGPRAQESGHDLNYIGSTGLLALQSGPSASPVVPPMLIADIAGGSMSAVLNILLALRQRQTTGEGCHLDIAMTDAMFTFAWHALATGAATGRYPGVGETLLTGGSPRYQLYPTRDGRLVACAPLEQKFWLAFTDAIGLAADLIDDRRDPAATRSAVARIIAERDAAQWQPIFARANCCVTIVATLEEAVRDPHFVARGLFAHQLTATSGARMPALPVPIAPAFRQPPEEPSAAAGAADATAPPRA